MGIPKTSWKFAEAIARELSIDERTVGSIRDAELLHDIGKIGIPGYILNEPGPLTYEEFNGIMKTHSTLGANIVRDVPLPAQYVTTSFFTITMMATDTPMVSRVNRFLLSAHVFYTLRTLSKEVASDRPYRFGREAIKRL